MKDFFRDLTPSNCDSDPDPVELLAQRIAEFQKNPLRTDESCSDLLRLIKSIPVDVKTLSAQVEGILLLRDADELERFVSTNRLIMHELAIEQWVGMIQMFGWNFCLLL